MKLFLKTFGIGLLLLSLVLVIGITFAKATPPGDDGEHKVAICHRTASDTNPYVRIEVDEAAVPAHIGNTLPGHNPTTWKSDGTFRGVAHVDGGAKDDYLAFSTSDCDDFVPTPTPTVTPPPPTCEELETCPTTPPPTCEQTEEGCPTPTPTVTPTPSTSPTPSDTPTPTTTPTPTSTLTPPPPTPTPTPTVVPPPPKTQPKDCEGNGASRPRCSTTTKTAGTPPATELAFTGSTVVPLALGALFLFLTGLGLLWRGRLRA